MYVFLGLPVTINLLTVGVFNPYLKRRYLGLSAPLAFYYGLVLFFSAATLVCKHFDIKFQMVTFGLMVVLLGQFIHLASQQRFKHVTTPLLGAGTSFFLALVCQITDQNGTWCTPVRRSTRTEISRCHSPPRQRRRSFKAIRSGTFSRRWRWSTFGAFTTWWLAPQAARYCSRLHTNNE
jgi:hypothetical protein